VLSDTDSLIESLDQLIAKKKAIKQGAMQELLTGKRRLPGFAKSTGYKQTELGVIPEDWEVRSSIEFCQKNGIKIGPFGSQLKKDFLVRNGYRVYGQENVFEDDFSFGERYIDSDRFSKLSSCELNPGDFVISMMGTIGECSIVPLDIEKGIMDSHLIKLRVNDSIICSRYLKYFFKTELLLEQIKRMSVGGIMDGLSSKIVKGLKICIPSVIEQQHISDVLLGMDQEISFLESKRDKYTQIKQGMMEQLLTGKVRLVG
jgi:type I restriction enzyme S subunit